MKILKEDNQFKREEVKKIFNKILWSRNVCVAYIEELQSILPEGPARYEAEKISMEIVDLVEKLRSVMKG